MTTSKDESFSTHVEFTKFDEELGLVLGFGIVTHIDGQPYYDVQGDHITDDAMLEAATEFMLKSQVAGVMHDRTDGGEPVFDGSVVFAFPLTAEIAKMFEIASPRLGLLVGVKPSADTLEKFRSGEFTGFSIGGSRIEEEVVEE